MLNNVMFYQYAREDDVHMCCPCVAHVLQRGKPQNELT
jgi:hypothetical protein